MAAVLSVCWLDVFNAELFSDCPRVCIDSPAVGTQILIEVLSACWSDVFNAELFPDSPSVCIDSPVVGTQILIEVPSAKNLQLFVG